MNSPYAKSYPCSTPECNSFLSDCNQKNQKKVYCNDCVYKRKNQRAKERRALVPKVESK